MSVHGGSSNCPVVTRRLARAPGVSTGETPVSQPSRWFFATRFPCKPLVWPHRQRLAARDADDVEHVEPRREVDILRQSRGDDVAAALCVAQGGGQVVSGVPERRRREAGRVTDQRI